MKPKQPCAEEKLQKIENQLVDIITSLSFLKGRSTKTARTIAYIYIYRKVTQKKLRELTGYSLGTVSNTLQTLEKMGSLNKTQNQKTREHTYTLEGMLPQSGSRSVSNIFDYFDQLKKFLKKTKNKLDQPSFSNKKGFEEVNQFVIKMSGVFPTMEQVIQETMTPQTNSQEDFSDQ